MNIYLQVYGRQVPHEEEEPLERNRQNNSETHTGLGIFLFQPDRMESTHTRHRVELSEEYFLSDMAKLA